MIGEAQKGTAILDVTPDLLAAVMHCLPRSFAVVGSERSRHGSVRLVLESAEIAPGYRAHMTCEISDEGCTRTATMRHCGPAPVA